MKFNLRTVHGYDFYEVSSCLQKSIRRGDARLAGFMALELWSSKYDNYLWKRLFTISAEDCWGILTLEIEALWQGYNLVNKGATERKGRIFVSKAVILLCQAKKSRDADHLSNFIYDKKDGLTVEQLENELENAPAYVELPNYIYDVHTITGKRNGMTKEQFFKDEFEALKPREKGLFDDVIEYKESLSEQPYIF